MEYEDKPEEKRSCMTCVHALLEDQGHSNYTVEGTDFTCKLGLHPDGTFDRWYGEDKRLNYASKCERYFEGKPEEHNVDCPYDCQCENTPFARTRK